MIEVQVVYSFFKFVSSVLSRIILTFTPSQFVCRGSLLGESSETAGIPEEAMESDPEFESCGP